MGECSFKYHDLSEYSQISRREFETLVSKRLMRFIAMRPTSVCAASPPCLAVPTCPISIIYDLSLARAVSRRGMLVLNVLL